MKTRDDHRGRSRPIEAPGEQDSKTANETTSTLAMVAVVAAGAAIFEVALLPGVVLGVAAMAAPKYLQRFSGALAPVLKSTARGVSDGFADARQQMSKRPPPNV